VTPRGYIFAEGHWDYSLDRRGVLFAPVYFPPSVYLRAGFTFSPGIVVDLGLLQINLFSYPRYCHYYFGDYYDGAYLSIGIYPWFESRRHHTWYDPIYEHERWRHHRSNPRWEEHRRDEYHRRFNDKNLRPAHTFREQESRLARLPDTQRQASRTTRSLDATVSDRKTSIKFEKIDADARKKISKQATAVRTYRDERKQWESPAASPKTARPSEDRKTTVPSQTERKQTVQPTEDRKTTVPSQTEHKQTIQPSEDRKTTVQTERKQTVQPTEDRKSAVVLPTERRQTVETPRKSESTVATPDLQRKSTSSPSRETRVSRPERIQIPASPVTGKQGIFQRGPPTHPAAESKGNMDTDIRRRSMDGT
jgi:hypothetical protein